MDTNAQHLHVNAATPGAAWRTAEQLPEVDAIVAVRCCGAERSCWLVAYTGRPVHELILTAQELLHEHQGWR